MAGVPMLIPKWILKKIGFTGTTSEVNAAITSGRIQEGDTVIITDDEGGGTISASAISYNNSSSGMSATAVQGAIDELNNDLTNIVKTTTISGTTNTYGIIQLPFTLGVPVFAVAKDNNDDVYPCTMEGLVNSSTELVIRATIWNGAVAQGKYLNVTVYYI